MHYLFYKNLYGPRAKLLMTDTDSLIYHLATENFVADMIDSSDVNFDIIDLLTPAELTCITGVDTQKAAAIVERFKAMSGALGAMKFEGKGGHFQEYVGLASKMYSLLLITIAGLCEHNRKSKGIPMKAVKQLTLHEDFRQMLFEPYVNYVTFNCLRSKNHISQRLEITKKGLTAVNDKVFQLNALESRPLNHYLNREHLDSFEGLTEGEGDEDGVGDYLNTPGGASSNS